MPDVKNIIQKILRKLDKLPNPSEEERAEFLAKELQRQNFSFEGGPWLQEYLDSINQKIKSMIAYNIKTKEEFIQRLIKILNASSTSDSANYAECNVLLLDVLLGVLFQLSSNQIKKEHPELFITEKLESIEVIQNLLKNWEDFIKNNQHLKTQEQIISIIVALMNPWKDYKVNFKEALTKLQEFPQNISDEDFLSHLQEIISFKDENCIILNPKLLDENGNKIKKNTFDVLSELDGIIDSNNAHIEKIINFKNSLNEKEDLREEKQKLIDFSEIIYGKMMEVNNTLKNKEENIKRLYDELNALSLYVKNIQEQSKLDNLIDVYNRKYIDKVAEVYEQQFKENSINYSVLFFDIDNFKNINDAYGHTAGDKLLGIFGNILKQNCRGTDMVGRYGGDEFLILMPNTDLERAKEFAKRICKTIEQTNFTYKEQKIKITTSIGIAERASHKNKFELIDSVDKFLYKAKNSGRNRVEWE
ncbi:GGDEF domain-containing protein [Helicobacter cappadocius]|uniref:diguanylate cyclase n=1 Tax=Helicobacter cappadocius TaxID=3063998 RepID=A0AA90PJC0_9HELI|nr:MULTISPECIES: GGDEF domain-containing protein [unclassified Helicobacter]MDO7253424.1 GGDEF domain-containing protein [Helicobacter sp. faydin-H75]MDP2539312.1 GGDEF domain-containing protein [Helicobacter sp. faydin-H76]